MTPTPANPLIPPRFLFRFSIPLAYEASLKRGTKIALDERHRLWAPGELDGQPPLADFRLAWNEQGLGLWVRVERKRQPVWCRSRHTVGGRRWVPKRTRSSK
jgi:hypothetical protein